MLFLYRWQKMFGVSHIQRIPSLIGFWTCCHSENVTLCVILHCELIAILRTGSPKACNVGSGIMKCFWWLWGLFDDRIYNMSQHKAWYRPWEADSFFSFALQVSRLHPSSLNIAYIFFKFRLACTCMCMPWLFVSVRIVNIFGVIASFWWFTLK